MTKKEFLEISKKILITADDFVISQLEAEYDFIDANLAYICQIDVNGVKPLVRISPQINWYREDKVLDKIDKKIMLENSAEHDNDYILIKRTIK